MENIITPKKLNREKDIFVRKTPTIERLGFSNKGAIKNIIGKNNNGEKIQTYATLCPFYDLGETGGIKGNYNKFEDISQRYQNKLTASLNVLEFLGKKFNLEINFLLADNGIIINERYDENRFNEDIIGITELYQNKISERLKKYNFETFSEFGIKGQKIYNLSKNKTTNETIKILESFGVSYEKFKFSLEIIEKSFGITGAYYRIKSYLEENMYLTEKLENSIFINTEATGPFNSLYSLGDYKINVKNLFCSIKYNSNL